MVVSLRVAGTAFLALDTSVHLYPSHFYRQIYQ
jgi:hypothetical protein